MRHVNPVRVIPLSKKLSCSRQLKYLLIRTETHFWKEKMYQIIPTLPDAKQMKTEVLKMDDHQANLYQSDKKILRVLQC